MIADARAGVGRFVRRAAAAAGRARVHLLGWETADAAEQRARSPRSSTRDISPVLTPLSLDARAPVPVRLEPLDLVGFPPRRPGQRRVGARARQGADASCPSGCACARWSRRPSACSSASTQVIAANAQKLFPGMVDREREPVPRLPRRRGRARRRTTAQQAGAWSSWSCSSGASSRSSGSRCSRTPIPRWSRSCGRRFALAPDDIYEMSALLDYTTLFEIAELARCPSCATRPGRRCRRSASRQRRTATSSRRSGAATSMLHQPYDSFDAGVERFIREAADDPQTLSIKMTVYRVGDDTPFVQSLIRAAEAGKQVACVIELNARFDEERNLHWSRELEKVGAHVVFGRQRPEDPQRRPRSSCARRTTPCAATRTSAPATTTRARARLYEDVGLLTADPRGDRRRRDAVPLPDRAARARRRSRRSWSRRWTMRAEFVRADRARDREPARRAGRRGSSAR